MYQLLMAQTGIGGEVTQVLESAKDTSAATLALVGITAAVVVILIVMVTRLRSEGTSGQVVGSLTGVINDFREERKALEKRQDEKDQRQRETILNITESHRSEMEKLTAALTMQVSVLTDVSSSSQTIQTEIEEITKTVVGINPETRLIAEGVHGKTREVVRETGDAVIRAVEENAKNLIQEVHNLRAAIHAVNENTYKVFADDGMLVQIAVQLQTITSILKEKGKQTDEEALSNLISGNAAADSNGHSVSTGNSGSQPGSVSDEHTSGSTDGSTTVNGSGHHPDSGSDSSRDTSTDTLTSR